MTGFLNFLSKAMPQGASTPAAPGPTGMPDIGGLLGGLGGGGLMGGGIGGLMNPGGGRPDLRSMAQNFGGVVPQLISAGTGGGLPPNSGLSALQKLLGIGG